MTSRITVSLPADVARFLEAQPNASATVTSAVQQMMSDEEAQRARRRAAAAAYARWLADDDGEIAAFDGIATAQAAQGMQW
jgi:Arc/MetJ-type ribon-helix-helix transcriptional regulator